MTHDEFKVWLISKLLQELKDGANAYPEEFPPNKANSQASDPSIIDDWFSQMGPTPKMEPDLVRIIERLCEKGIKVRTERDGRAEQGKTTIAERLAEVRAKLLTAEPPKGRRYYLHGDLIDRTDPLLIRAFPRVDARFFFDAVHHVWDGAEREGFPMEQGESHFVVVTPRTIHAHQADLATLKRALRTTQSTLEGEGFYRHKLSANVFSNHPLMRRQIYITKAMWSRLAAHLARRRERHDEELNLLLKADTLWGS